MSQSSKAYRDYDAYVSHVFMQDPAFSIDRMSQFGLQIPDHTLVTLPTASSSGSEFVDDWWIWPEFLFPHLPPSLRRLDFTLPFSLRSFGAIQLLITIKTFLVICMMYPLGKRKRLPSLRSSLHVINSFAIEMVKTTRFRSFAELDAVTYEKLIDNSSRGRPSFRIKLIANLEALREYGRRGFISDFPGAQSISTSPSSHVLALDLSENLNDDPIEKIERSDGESERQFRPLEDEYLAAMGTRCVFYLDQIGPNLVRLYSADPDMEHRRKEWWPKGRKPSGPGRSTVDIARSRAWQRYLQEFVWIDHEGNPIQSLPFHCDHMTFPPAMIEDVGRLVGRHMDALLHMLLLLSGGRSSEVRSMTRTGAPQNTPTPNAPAGSMMVEGRTMKPSATNRGDERNWPVPEIVASWIANQTELAERLGPPNSNSLWMSMSTTHPNISRIDAHYRCTAFATRHGLSHLIEGSAHPHRYRKSIARLALLALTGAPVLIMQMFGHRDLMTTLRYLLSDPFIRQDLRELLGERRVEIALHLMNDIDHAAGPAANEIRTARDAYFDDLKVPLNARSQRISLLQFVTAQLVDGAVDIKIVYPGVVCIRGIEQDGACTKKGRQIDPGKCQSKCKFRIDLSLRRSEVAAIIEDCLTAYLDARQTGNLLAQSALAANVIDNVEIYPDINASYLNDERYQVLMRDCHAS